MDNEMDIDKKLQLVNKFCERNKSNIAHNRKIDERINQLLHERRMAIRNSSEQKSGITWTDSDVEESIEGSHSEGKEAVEDSS